MTREENSKPRNWFQKQKDRGCLSACLIVSCYKKNVLDTVLISSLISSQDSLMYHRHYSGEGRREKSRSDFSLNFCGPEVGLNFVGWRIFPQIHEILKMEG